MKTHVMKLPIPSMAAMALFAGVLMIGLTPAEATVIAPSQADMFSVEIDVRYVPIAD